MSSNRLLLIEDHYDVAEMLTMYFQAHGYQLLHADSGADGVEMARRYFPNLILLDLELPDMDGYDICLQLRQMALTKYIPIIFLTQHDERAKKVRGLELGADDYVTKPFDIDELRLRVQASIRRATRENLHESRTGLPTGPLVEEELLRRRSSHHEMWFMVNGFEAYRDVYSFMAANDVISHAGRTIQSVISTQGTPQDFVGIIDNHFVVLTRTEDPRALEAAICARFAEEVRAFYTFVDAERGGMLINENTEDEAFVPMMTLVCQPQDAPSG